MSVTLQPLPIVVSEIVVRGESTFCAARDDPRARALWSTASRHYDVELSANGVGAWTLVFDALVPPESLGVIDTTRLHRVFIGGGGRTPMPAQADFYGQHASGLLLPRWDLWRYPWLESIQAWHFGDTVFARLNRLAFPPGSTGDTVIAFCSRNRDQPFIRGTLILAPDTTLVSASWEFVTPAPKERAGGRVVFAPIDPRIPGRPLLAMAGLFWRRRVSDVYQEWLEFRHWSRCESGGSCVAPVPLN